MAINLAIRKNPTPTVQPNTLIVPIAAVFLAVVPTAMPAQAAPSFELVSVRKIWDAGAHNAFTDLTRFRNHWYCTFREADDHVGGDGRIRVLISRDGEKWESAALLAESGIDLRDPKMSITPDNRLMIVAGGSVYGGTRILKSRQPRVMFSKDGFKWTLPQRVLGDGDWLWRVVWHKGRAYGVSYDHTRAKPGDAPVLEGRGAPEWHIKLVDSADGVSWNVVTVLPVNGRPNETTIRFLPGGQCVAFIRREGPEADRKQGWIGISKAAPYKDWTFKPAGHQIGGPNFIVLPDGSMVGGGRDYRKAPKHVTAIGNFTLDGYSPDVELPSAGDNSYPGFVWEKGVLWTSYYSTHEGKTSIYLARIRRK